MESEQRKGFTRFEGVLGLTVLGIALTVCLAPLPWGLSTEPAARATLQAKDLAVTVSDYHREKGHWPGNDQGEIDWAVLTISGPSSPGFAEAATGIMDGEPVPPEDKPWLREIPVDPWGRPFRGAVLAPGGDRTDEAVAVVVLSCGPDGVLNTDLENIWHRTGLKDAFDGDDEGYILRQTLSGGSG